MPNDHLYPHVERFAKCGRLLDLGCGPGTTGNNLQPGTYSSYVGVDISDVAIQKARDRTAHNNRSQTNIYFQSDMSSFTPTGQYDVIIFGDSLYYLPRHIVGWTLERYGRHLREDGVFIVRLRGEYAWLANLIRKDFSVVEVHEYSHGISVFVFRPMTSAVALPM
jgi:predicted TPR repeat methyltransferase